MRKFPWRREGNSLTEQQASRSARKRSVQKFRFQNGFSADIFVGMKKQNNRFRTINNFFARCLLERSYRSVKTDGKLGENPTKSFCCVLTLWCTTSSLCHPNLGVPSCQMPALFQRTQLTFVRKLLVVCKHITVVPNVSPICCSSCLQQN